MIVALYPNFQKRNALKCAREACDVLNSSGIDVCVSEDFRKDFSDKPFVKFEDIKNMSKQEFEQFLFKVQSSNQKFCVRCGNFTLDRITISVAKNGNSPRKLCNMCKDCYTDMLDYLGVNDIEE